MTVNGAFLVAGRDDHGRVLARIIHAHPFWLREPPPPSTRLTDPDDGSDTGLTVYGRLVVTDRTFPLPPAESHSRDAEHQARRQHDLSWNKRPEPPALPELDVGDLLVAEHCRGWPDDVARGDTDTLRVSGVRRLGRGLDEAAAAAMVIAEVDPDGRRFLCLTDSDGIRFEADSVRACREPNEALVLVWRGNSTWRDPEAVRLGGTGGWFFHCDGNDARENGIEFDDDPGIYFFSNGKSWSTGDGVWEDYDSGIEGDLEPAGLEHLTRLGYDVAGLRAEMADAMEDVLEPGQDPFDLLASQGAVVPDWAKQRQSAPPGQTA